MNKSKGGKKDSLKAHEAYEQLTKALISYEHLSSLSFSHFC